MGKLLLQKAMCRETMHSQLQGKMLPFWLDKLPPCALPVGKSSFLYWIKCQNNHSYNINIKYHNYNYHHNHQNHNHNNNHHFHNHHINYIYYNQQHYDHSRDQV